MLILVVARNARPVRVVQLRERRRGGRIVGTQRTKLAAAASVPSVFCAFCQRTVLEPSSSSLRPEYAAESSAPNLPSKKRSLMRNAPRGSSLSCDVVVRALQRGHEREAVVVERARGAQVHRGAERALFHFRRRGLADGDGVEQLGGESVEIERAVAVGAAGCVRAAVRAHGLHAVHAHTRELRAEAAHGHLAPFAGVSRNGDAGNALDGLREIQVGKFRDVFGDDRIDCADGVTLDVERGLETQAETADYDFLHRAVLVLLRCSRAHRTHLLRERAVGRTPAQRSNDCHTDHGARCAVRRRAATRD